MPRSQARQDRAEQEPRSPRSHLGHRGRLDLVTPAPVVPASPSLLLPWVCRWEASGSQAASFGPREKRSLPLAFLAGHPLNNTVFLLGWVTENRAVGVGCALQLMWPVSCAVTSARASLTPPATLKEVRSGSSKVWPPLLSPRSLGSEEDRDSVCGQHAPTASVCIGELSSGPVPARLGHPCWLPPPYGIKAIAFCLAREGSKTQPSFHLALSAQGDKPLKTGVQEGLLLDSGAWLLGWGWARSGSQAMRSSTQGLSLKEAQELGWSHQWLAGFICLIFSECSMWAGTEPSRLPRDISCVPGVKDLAPKRGPFLPPCPGSQDAHTYVVSPPWRREGLALTVTCSGQYQVFPSWQVQHWSGQSGGTYGLTVLDT